MADIDGVRLERLLLALENATNALNRMAQAHERKGKRADASIRRRVKSVAPPANENAASAVVRAQVEKSLRRMGR